MKTYILKNVTTKSVIAKTIIKKAKDIFTVFLLIQLSPSTILANSDYQSLLLSRNRTEALSVIIKEINSKIENLETSAKGKKTNKNKTDTKIETKIKNKINLANRVSDIFFSDQEQQKYERAMSLRHKDKRQSIRLLQEILSVEDDNARVRTSIAEIRLEEKSCQQAKQQIDRVLKLNPFHIDASILNIVAEFCENKITDSETDLSWYQFLSEGWKKSALQLEYLYRGKAYSRVLGISHSLKESSAPQILAVLYEAMSLKHLDLLESSHVSIFIERCKNRDLLLNKDPILVTYCIYEDKFKSYVKEN